MDKDMLNALDDLVRVGNLVFELFKAKALQEGKSSEEAILVALQETKTWMTQPNALCFNKVPQDIILINQGKELISFLEAKQGL